MILEKETLEKFGYKINEIGTHSIKPILLKCDFCGQTFISEKRKITESLLKEKHKCNDKKCKRQKLLEYNNITNFYPKIGDKFGKLTIIGEPFLKEFYTAGRHDAAIKCKCDCGKEKIIRISYLKKNRIKSCGCLKNQKGNLSHSFTGYKEISGLFWCQVKRSAYVRNIPFKITIKQAWDLFLKQEKRCVLSGEVLKFKTENNKECTASLDRINSKKNYTIDNVQWLHKDINCMKWDKTDKEFKEICKKVANYTISSEIEDYQI